VETRKWPLLAALLYPFAIATVAAGMLAFVMILLGLDLLLVATVVLLFYFAASTAIYIISKDALKIFGLHRCFLGLTASMGVLALLSVILLCLGISS
jgi:hypothetical protein